MFYDDSICVILRHLFYEYHYSPHKLAFQNIMRAGDQKLMIDLEWPNKGSKVHGAHLRLVLIIRCSVANGVIMTSLY